LIRPRVKVRVKVSVSIVIFLRILVIFEEKPVAAVVLRLELGLG